MSAPVRLTDLPGPGQRIIRALLAAENAARAAQSSGQAWPSPSDGGRVPGTTPGPARRRSGPRAAA